MFDFLLMVAMHGLLDFGKIGGKSSSKLISFAEAPSLARYQHKKLKCTGFYISLPRMKEWDFLIKTLFEFCRYFQYELNYDQFTVSLIRDFLYCNYSITMGVNNELFL